MFVIARIILGYGTSASGISGPAYLAETLPLHCVAGDWGYSTTFTTWASKFVTLRLAPSPVPADGRKREI
ncbi:hypothetical protein BDP27DRAFT_1329076 [Rhodocollybia butyracea]|uniref:Uncharacterized protein n=1 Tax=Rhodocollybia butyracea TaxID=206335 RepID=A0A9P5U5U4_9AGAR|nr:hypothetical protein BDP27DRAFT_1329076 [Rhodocollybia butyracea]